MQTTRKCAGGEPSAHTSTSCTPAPISCRPAAHLRRERHANASPAAQRYETATEEGLQSTTSLPTRPPDYDLQPTDHPQLPSCRAYPAASVDLHSPDAVRLPCGTVPPRTVRARSRRSNTSGHGTNDRSAFGFSLSISIDIRTTGSSSRLAAGWSEGLACPSASPTRDPPRPDAVYSADRSLLACLPTVPSPSAAHVQYTVVVP